MSYVCELCQGVVDPHREELVLAREQAPIRSLDGTDESIDGLGVFFHPGCYPGVSGRYRRLTPDEKAEELSLLSDYAD